MLACGRCSASWRLTCDLCDEDGKQCSNLLVILHGEAWTSDGGLCRETGEVERRQHASLQRRLCCPSDGLLHRHGTYHGESPPSIVNVHSTACGSRLFGLNVAQPPPRLAAKTTSQARQARVCDRRAYLAGTYACCACAILTSSRHFSSLNLHVQGYRARCRPASIATHIFHRLERHRDRGVSDPSSGLFSARYQSGI